MSSKAQTDGVCSIRHWLDPVKNLGAGEGGKYLGNGVEMGWKSGTNEKWSESGGIVEELWRIIGVWGDMG